MTTSPMYLLILCFMALLVLTLRSTYWHRLHQLLHQVTTTTTRVSRFGQEKQANTFARNIEEGLSSANFDLQLNVINQDQRQGLENTDEIRQLMSDHGYDFDQARLFRQQRMMAAHGIDPETGCPLDPKAVYFS
ncbi:hypothetical protein CPB97_012121 [Podila verticillata]|nr:hypothetical protein CPB97_012121 [Podila verticillata]